MQRFVDHEIQIMVIQKNFGNVKFFRMEEISQESLVINQKRRNVSSININFPPDFKNQLINAARITTDRHLTQAGFHIDVFELEF